VAHPLWRRAFTLVELLVVIAIIGVLVALLLPAVQAAREAARRMKCQNNLKQLALAAHNYTDVVGVYPSAGISTNETSWMVHILPFIEQKNLYDQFNFAAGTYTSGTNQVGRNALALNRIDAYLCPSSSLLKMPTNAPHNAQTPEIINGATPYTSHYYGVQGPKGSSVSGGTYVLNQPSNSHGGFAANGIMQCDGRVRIAEVTDGTSNTLIFGELSWFSPTVGSRFRTWMRGCIDTFGASNPTRNVNSSINTLNIATFNDIAFGSMHPNGANFALADGSVRYLTNNIALGVFKAAASRDGAESTSLD
jgi:prepilin-type N-terminal cleavage/methylation domain-containing protein/prepilin-type processing-associated H-X9-DG protein